MPLDVMTSSPTRRLATSARCAAICRRCGRTISSRNAATRRPRKRRAWTIECWVRAEPDRRSMLAERLRSTPSRGSGPRVLLGLEQARPGSGIRGHVQAEVRVRGGCRDPAPRCPLEQTLLEEERLVDVLDRLGFFGDRDRERVEPDGLAAEGLAQRPQDRAVDLVEAALVDLEQREGGAGRRRRYGPVAPHLGVVAHALEKAVRDPWRAPGPARDLARAGGVERDAEDAGGALEDGDQVLGLVVVEPADEPEAVPKGPRDQAGAGRGTHEREPGQVESDRARRRPLPDDDVELEVLHRGVQDLLHRAGEPVHLVDEEDVTVVEVGEDGGEVAGALQGGPAGDAQCHTELGGDDPGQRRLPGSGWAGEQQVVDGLAPPSGRAEQDVEVLLEPLLTHELGEAPRAERRLLGALDRVRGRAEQLFPRHGLPPTASTRRAGGLRRGRRPEAGRGPRAPRRTDSRDRRAPPAPRRGST